MYTVHCTVSEATLENKNVLKKFFSSFFKIFFLLSQIRPLKFILHIFFLKVQIFLFHTNSVEAVEIYKIL